MRSAWSVLLADPFGPVTSLDSFSVPVHFEHFTAAQSERDELKAWCQHPFTIVSNGVTWIVATDAKWLVALKAEALPVPPSISDPKIGASLAEYLSLEARDTYLADLDTLREWAGPIPAPGDEYDIHDIRPGLICWIRIDHRRLARLLTAFPDKGEILIWGDRLKDGHKSVSTLFLSTVDLKCRVLLVGLSSGTGGGDDYNGLQRFSG